MDIVIVSEFCEDFSKSDNDRFLYIAKMLCKKHNVEIVTSDFRHTTKKKRTKIAAKWPFRITFLHEPGYLKNICLRRFYSHFIWGRNVGRYLKSRTRPDVIYCAVPSLTAANEVATYCRKNGTRFIIDVQDLWPEAFQMVFHVPVVSNIVFLPFYLLANRVYKLADHVVAVSKTYAKRIVRARDIKKATVVFLGTNLDDFDRNVRNNIGLQKNGKELWIGYCGTLGASYDIDVVIYALWNIRKSGEIPPKFIIMGEGDRKEEFEKLAKEKKVDVCFTGRISYDKMCAILSKCDMVVNPIHDGSVGSIINKHADYAACGLPVLNTQNSAEYRQLVHQYKMGFNCENEFELAEKIKILAKNEGLRAQMSVNARQCAEDKFDRNKTYKRIECLTVTGKEE